MFILYDSIFEDQLSETIPVVYASIAGCRIVGSMVTGKWRLYCLSYLLVCDSRKCLVSILHFYSYCHHYHHHLFSLIFLIFTVKLNV